MGNPGIYGKRRFGNMMGQQPSGAALADIGNDTSDTSTIYAACTVTTTQKFYFRDSGLYVYSNADGKLTISSDGTGTDDITFS